MEDGQILDLFFARDESAIRETDRKYGSKLHSISQSITGDSADAEECVSDTYLAAWNQIPPARPTYYFAFLCRILRNISYNLFHKNTAQKRSGSIVSLDEELCELLPDPHTALCGEASLGDAISRFLSTADKETRYLFVRRYFYADSLSSLAGLTGISENGISLRLLRIRKKLRTFLEKEGFTI